MLLAPFAKFTSQSACAGSYEKRSRLDSWQTKALQHSHVAIESTNPPYRDGFICGSCIQWKGWDAEWDQCAVAADAGWHSAGVKRQFNLTSIKFVQNFPQQHGKKIVPCRNKYLTSFQTIADPCIPSNSELLTNSRSLNAARFGGDKLIDKAF